MVAHVVEKTAGVRYGSGMAKRKDKPEKKPKKAGNNPWPALLARVQDHLDISNEEMAARLDVSLRAYVSWKWGERQPSAAQQKLLKPILDNLQKK